MRREEDENDPQLREEADKACRERIAAFRSKDWTEDELGAAMLGLSKKGNVPWRQELLYMLSASQGEPLSSIARAIGVTTKQVMSLRRRDDEVAQACQDYLGAYFEDEAMLPEKCIRPQIIVAALGNHAHGWNKAVQDALTPDKAQAMIRAILDAIKLHVPDAEVQKRIGESIKAALDRNSAQGTPNG